MCSPSFTCQNNQQSRPVRPLLSGTVPSGERPTRQWHSSAPKSELGLTFPKLPTPSVLPIL